jgi:hypothetical protein
MPQRASVFCNFYIRVDREALVSERALDVGSVAFKAMSTKNSISILLLLLELNKVCKNVFTKEKKKRKSQVYHYVVHL